MTEVQKCKAVHTECTTAKEKQDTDMVRTKRVGLEGGGNWLGGVLVVWTLAWEGFSWRVLVGWCFCTVGSHGFITGLDLVGRSFY